MYFLGNFEIVWYTHIIQYGYVFRFFLKGESKKEPKQIKPSPIPCGMGDGFAFYSVVFTLRSYRRKPTTIEPKLNTSQRMPPIATLALL